MLEWKPASSKRLRSSSWPLWPETQQESIPPASPNQRDCETPSPSYSVLCLSPSVFLAPSTLWMANSCQLAAGSTLWSKVDFVTTVSGFTEESNTPMMSTLSWGANACSFNITALVSLGEISRGSAPKPLPAVRVISERRRWGTRS